jgi:hypothetical protein
MFRVVLVDDDYGSIGEANMACQKVQMGGFL